MGIKVYKPTSPGRRGMSVSTFDEITRATPEKSLLRPLKKRAGRNNQGRLTVRHQGGGHKRRYRLIDFKRDKIGVPARVASIEYDPNRSARIALLVYADGEKRYIIAPLGLQVGDALLSGAEAEIRPGNALPLMNIPLAHWCTMWSCNQDAAANSYVQPGPMPSSWPKRAPTPSYACPAARRVASCWIAWPPLVRSATPIIRTLIWARPDANAGWACGQKCVVQPWTPIRIHMAAVKVARRLV